MKNKKFKIVLLTTLIVSSISFVNAENVMTSTWKTLKIERQKINSEIKNSKNELKSKVNLNREEIKNNLKEIKTLRTWSWVFKNLDETTRKILKETQESHKTKLLNLKNEYDEKIKKSSSLEEKDILREELRTKTQEINKTFFESLKILLSSYPETISWLEAREKVASENNILREQNNNLRKEFRSESSSKIVAYKEKYISSLGTSLDVLSAKNPEALDKMLLKVETMIKKYQEKTNMSKENKDKILSQLEAIKEIIEDKISDSNNMLEDLL